MTRDRKYRMKIYFTDLHVIGKKNSHIPYCDSYQYRMLCTRYTHNTKCIYSTKLYTYSSVLKVNFVIFKHYYDNTIINCNIRYRSTYCFYCSDRQHYTQKVNKRDVGFSCKRYRHLY